MSSNFWAGFEKKAVSFNWINKRTSSGLVGRLKGPLQKLKARLLLNKANSSVAKKHPMASKHWRQVLKTPEQRKKFMAMTSEANKISKKPSGAKAVYEGTRRTLEAQGH